MVVSAQRPSKTQERGLRIDYIRIIKDMYGFYCINWESNGEEKGIAWWFMRARALYLTSAGDEGMRASIVYSTRLGSGGTLGQRPISSRKANPARLL